MADLVFGLGPVLEALAAGRRRVRRVWLLASAEPDPRREAILRLAAEAGVEVVRADRAELDRRAGGGARPGHPVQQVHQGAVAEADPLPRLDLEAALAAARAPALVVVLDEVQDPQNLGAVLRTAECAGADFVVVPRDRSASLTPAVVKVAEGAAEHLPVVTVTNLRRALDQLREAGLWTVGLDAKGERAWSEVDWTLPVALVLGSEGRGLRRLTREGCDIMARVPLLGRTPSLNVSVAAAVALYEAVRQRRGGGAG